MVSPILLESWQFQRFAIAFHEEGRKHRETNIYLCSSGQLTATWNICTGSSASLSAHELASLANRPQWQQTAVGFDEPVGSGSTAFLPLQVVVILYYAERLPGIYCCAIFLGHFSAALKILCIHSGKCLEVQKKKIYLLDFHYISCFSKYLKWKIPKWTNGQNSKMMTKFSS